MFQEIIDMLEIARNVMMAEALIVSRNNGNEWTKQIIKMDNRVYDCISIAIDLLNEMEEDEPS